MGVPYLNRPVFSDRWLRTPLVLQTSAGVWSASSIATVEGHGAASHPMRLASGNLTMRDEADAVSYWNQRKQRNVAGAGERTLPQEVQSEMREISKGGQPNMLARCVEQALANPYSGTVEMNQAMGYVALSTVGPHYLNISLLAGLLTETSQGWLRATQAGRALAAGGTTHFTGVWNALLSLPVYRRYLEYKILTIKERNRARSAVEFQQIETAAYEAFPAFRNRAVSIQQMLALDDLNPDRAIAVLRSPPTLEPVGWEALHAWMSAHGLGPQRVHLSRAREIAQALAQAASIPLTVSSEWLEPAQLLALLLLIAARQRGQGVMLAAGVGAGRSGSSVLARAVDVLRRSGLDIRLEQRSYGPVATLIPAITLRIASAAALNRLMEIGSTDLAEVIHLVVTTLNATLCVGLDGEVRGAIAPAELASRLDAAGYDGAGAFTSAAAADEIAAAESALLVGAPLPLASDLPLLGCDYRFLREAVAGRGARGWRGGVAALLSEWSVQQRRPPVDELAVNPHLALLYLIVADMDERTHAIRRHDMGWLVPDTPLATALDDRLRALGYEVWDEGYCADAQRMRALGDALVEQGLSVGVLTPSDDPAFPLGAPTRYGYYDAVELLAVEPTRRPER